MPKLPAEVFAQICELQTIKWVIDANALLMPVSIATEWEAIKATLRTLKARHPVAETKDSLQKVHDFMEELQRHPGTFVYMRTYMQSGPKALAPVLKQLQQGHDVDLNLAPAANDQQLAVYTSQEQEAIVQASSTPS